MRGEGELGADDSGVLHHAFDLLVQFVAVGDDEDAGLGIVLQQPLGEQHHQDALAAALGVPDDAALALGDAFLRGLHAEELVRPRHFLEPASKMMKLRIRSSSRVLLHIWASGRSSSAPAAGSALVVLLVFPLHEELLRRADGAVAQPLRVAARQARAAPCRRRPC